MRISHKLVQKWSKTGEQFLYFQTVDHSINCSILIFQFQPNYDPKVNQSDIYTLNNKKYIRGEYELYLENVQLKDGGIIYCGHSSERLRLNVVDMQQLPTITHNGRFVAGRKRYSVLNVTEDSYIGLVCQFSYFVSPISDLMPLAVSWKVHSKSHLWEGPGDRSTKITKFDNNYNLIQVSSKIQFKVGTQHDKLLYQCRATDWNNATSRITDVKLMVTKNPMSTAEIVMIVLFLVLVVILSVAALKFYPKLRQNYSFNRLINGFDNSNERESIPGSQFHDDKTDVEPPQNDQ